MDQAFSLWCECSYRMSLKKLINQWFWTVDNSILHSLTGNVFSLQQMRNKPSVVFCNLEWKNLFLSIAQTTAADNIAQPSQIFAKRVYCTNTRKCGQLYPTQRPPEENADDSIPDMLQSTLRATADGAYLLFDGSSDSSCLLVHHRSAHSAQNCLWPGYPCTKRNQSFCW